MRSWLFLVGAWCSCAVAWGTITWGEPRDITGDADVNTNGVQVYAYSWRYTNIDRILLNGEEFVPGGSSRAAGVDISAPGLSVWEASTSGNCVRNWSSNQVATATCSANYLHCLSAPIHGQASDVSLKNLVPGRTYEVQLWSSSCFPESAGRTILLDGTRSVSMNVGTAAEPKLGQHVTGRFVAGADGVETFHLADPSSNNVKWAPLNMIQLRDVTETPVISWTVGDIQADTDVATEGRLLYAYTESGEATTVNGVPFAAGNSQTPQSLPGPNEGTADCFFPEIVSCAVSAFSSSNLSDAYAKVVKGGIYRDQVSRDLVLRGLEIGRSYLVQLWVNDSRSGIILRRIILDGACSLQYRRENGNGQYAIGRFRASARTQRIRMTLDPSLSNQSFQLNAIQVRALDTDGIQWTSAATTSEADVLTEGTCVYAYTWYTNALTVGGVSFAPALNSAAGVGTLGDITAVGFLNVNTYIDYQPYAEEKGASATLHDFLRFGLYSQVVRGAQLQLHHLTPGVSYAVQLFVADGRSAGSTSSRAVRVDGMERLPHGTTSRPLGSFAVGHFVARAADVTIPLQPYGNLSITGSDLSCQVNAIQVRRLGADASCGEPTAWTVADVAAATDVSTEGTLLYAYTPASGGVTVNGVAFANASFSRDIGTDVRMSNHPTSFYSGFATSYPGSLTDSAYLKLLGNGNYLDSTFNETTVTLGNLTAGHAYLVQVWVNDLRPGDGTGRFWYADRDTSRKIYYKTGGANAGQHAIGRFTATGSERTFTMTFPNKNAQLNALQVRDLGLAMAGFAPEGTSLVLNDAVETNALIVTSSLTVTGTGTLNASNGVLGGTCVLNVPWVGRDLVTGADALTLNAGADELDVVRVHRGTLTLNAPMATAPFCWVEGTLAVGTGNTVAARGLAGSGLYSGPGTIVLSNACAGATAASLGGGLSVRKAGDFDWLFKGTLDQVALASEAGRIQVVAENLGVVGLDGAVQFLGGAVAGTVTVANRLQAEGLRFASGATLALTGAGVLEAKDDLDLTGVTVQVAQARRAGGNVLVTGAGALTGTPTFVFAESGFRAEYNPDLAAWCARFRAGTTIFIR